MQFTFQRIHPLKAYGSVDFGKLTQLGTHTHGQGLRHSQHPLNFLMSLSGLSPAPATTDVTSVAAVLLFLELHRGRIGHVVCAWNNAVEVHPHGSTHQHRLLSVSDWHSIKWLHRMFDLPPLKDTGLDPFVFRIL